MEEDLLFVGSIYIAFKFTFRNNPLNVIDTKKLFGRNNITFIPLAPACKEEYLLFTCVK